MGLLSSLLRVASGAEAWVHRTSKAMAIIAAFVLLAMTLLTVADVSGRYFLNKPISGTWEIVGLLLVCGGTWGLAYCQMEKGHIRVTAIVDLFSPKVQAVVRSLGYLIGLAGFSLICWRAMLLTDKYLSTKGYITDTLHIPLYPFTLIMAIGAGMLALMLFIDTVRSVTEVVRQ